MAIVAYYLFLRSSIFLLSLKKNNILFIYFFLFRLKSLQAQEESRHKNPEHRSSMQRSTEQRRSESRRLESRHAEVRTEPRRSEHRRTEQRGTDKRGADKWSPEAVQEYEDQPRTLKDAPQGRSDTVSQIFSFKFLLLVTAWLGKRKSKMTSLDPNPDNTGSFEL